ncbi:MAG TPA: 50S ribosomal protein L10 [Patescibacteria group bacterium]|nr:50S ribosomal protein L10 [Patescibacteria group bacterium]
MAKTKQQKSDDLAELTEKVKQAKSMVFTGYSGTTVPNMDKFRRAAEKDGVFSKVYKVTLVRKALESAGVNAESVDFKQPVILSLSTDDETAAAKLVKAQSKDIQTLGILAGYVDGALISKAQVVALADMPGKQDLRGALVRTINAPVSGFVNVLAGNIRGLVNVLNAVATK